MTRFLNRNKWPYLFLFPWVLFFAVFTLYPFLSGIVLSFYDYDFVKLKFIFFDNFVSIFKDGLFLNSILTTLKFALVIVPVTIVLSLLIANMISSMRAGAQSFLSMLKEHYGYIPFMYSFGKGQVVVKCFTGTDKLMDKDEFDICYNEKRKVMTSGGILDEIMNINEDVNKSSDIMYRFFRSNDSGKTWGIWGCPNFTSLTRLKDGTLLGMFRIGKCDDSGSRIKVWRSMDDGVTWEGPDYSPLIGPKIAEIGGYGIIFHRSAVELEDGAILVTAYTRLEGDQKDRVVIYRSNDKGQSFYYYSTVAFDSNIDNVDGINEPVMQKLQNGELLCLMRTNAFLPIIQSRSVNGGATWSEPEKTGMDGVDPDMIRLENDVLVCSYGRPGVWLSFSEDGNGRLWSDKTCLWQADNGRRNIQFFKDHDNERYRYYMDSILECERSLCLERSCCYTALCGLGEGRFLVAYSAPKCSDDFQILPKWDTAYIKNYYILIAEVQITSR